MADRDTRNAAGVFTLTIGLLTAVGRASTVGVEAQD